MEIRELESLPGGYQITLENGRKYNIFTYYHIEKDYYSASYGPYSATGKSALEAVEKVAFLLGGDK